MSDNERPLMEIIEKPVIRYEVVCREHGLINEFADIQDAYDADRRHRRLHHGAPEASGDLSDFLRVYQSRERGE